MSRKVKVDVPTKDGEGTVEVTVKVDDNGFVTYSHKGKGTPDPELLARALEPWNIDVK
ncbi:hypothetical protein [Ktedonospora formicarum]|uniref:Uncharacterized protein n=1 Tax=Ktedonospora formicarum TaxID=2778364 RepID=A0A8J3IB66_9CHLR|nr:hypothetical protein [Ktedonospora formicarum]GHO48114.1 hypothetical protein KSX_62770 [Ktedonospora formicarum]